MLVRVNVPRLRPIGSNEFRSCRLWTAEVGVLFTLCYWPFTVPSSLNFILCSAVRLWLFAFVPVVILFRVWLQFSVGFPVPTWLTVKFRCDNELLSFNYAFHKLSRSSSWQSFAMIPFSSSIIFTFGFAVYPDPILLDAIVQCRITFIHYISMIISYTCHYRFLVRLMLTDSIREVICPLNLVFPSCCDLSGWRWLFLSKIEGGRVCACGRHTVSYWSTHGSDDSLAG